MVFIVLLGEGCSSNVTRYKDKEHHLQAMDDEIAHLNSMHAKKTMLASMYTDNISNVVLRVVGLLKPRFAQGIDRRGRSYQTPHQSAITPSPSPCFLIQ